MRLPATTALPTPHIDVTASNEPPVTTRQIAQEAGALGLVSSAVIAAFLLTPMGLATLAVRTKAPETFAEYATELGTWVGTTAGMGLGGGAALALTYALARCLTR